MSSPGPCSAANYYTELSQFQHYPTMSLTPLDCSIFTGLGTMKDALQGP